jgi:sigma-B regulation protein RsbU (phosphoserine phosphatase)
VGIEPNMEFKIQQANMAPGDILLGYTDGVTEAVASDGSFFTMDRLMSILEAPASTAKELLDRIANNLQEHVDSADQFDDITMLAVRRISR